MPEVTDVVVVGAGVAGLACARELARRGAGVTVLEARDRIGGRIRTARLLGDGVVELGAQVIHGGRARTWEIIRAAGLRVAPLEVAGDLIVGLGGRAWTVADLLAGGSVPPWTVEEQLALLELEVEAPDRPVAEMLAAVGLTGSRRQIALEWLCQTWCAAADELSAVGVRNARRARSSDRGEFVISDGYDRVPEWLASGLDVRLGAPTTAVGWRAGNAEVHAGRERWHASAVVLTVPAPVLAAGGLRFDPPLPARKLQASRAVRVGDALVLLAGLRQPAPRSVFGLLVGECGGFWRSREGSRLLIGWIRGPAAGQVRRLRPHGDLVARLTRPILPWIRPGLVDDEVVVADWGADPWSMGGYSYPTVSALDAPAVLASPIGDTLFFAGEATCTDGNVGLVQGAMDSGVRAAGEVATVLGGMGAGR